MTQFEKQPNITKEKFLPNRFGLKKKLVTIYKLFFISSSIWTRWRQ